MYKEIPRYILLKYLFILIFVVYNVLYLMVFFIIIII